MTVLGYSTCRKHVCARLVNNGNSNVCATVHVALLSNEQRDVNFMPMYRDDLGAVSMRSRVRVEAPAGPAAWGTQPLPSRPHRLLL